jgi:hypothetical protein
MDKLVSMLLAVALGVGGFVFYQKQSAWEQERQRLVDIQNVAIDASVLQSVSELTFSKVVVDFQDVLKREGVAPIPWKGVHHYKWAFEYNFGVNVPGDWTWNFVDHGNGVVSVDIPPLRQLNDYNVSIELIDRINPANGARTAAMNAEMRDIALEKVKLVEDRYLNNPTIVESTRRSMAAFLQDLFNSQQPENPVTKVQVNFKA